MDYEAYIFDMDGVLADNCDYHVLAWQAFARRHGSELTERQIRDWMGAPGSVYVERMLGRPVAPGELARLCDEKEALYREIYAPHLECPPGLRALLDAARARGVRFAVATGGPRENVDFVLDGNGLRDYFAAVVDAGQYARPKPEPECYLRAAELLGADPAKCVVFEDAVLGVRAGKAAGMRVVAITRTMPRAALVAAGADRVIDSFAEVDAVP